MEVRCVLAPGAKKPVCNKLGDAGYDLFPLAAHTIYPGQRLIVSTGVRLAIPVGYYGRIAERSGTGAKGLAVGAGVIDSNYRGDIGIVLRNLRFFGDPEPDDDLQLFFKWADYDPQHIGPEKAIAQIIFEKHYDFPIVQVAELDVTLRGEKGYGSSDR